MSSAEKSGSAQRRVLLVSPHFAPINAADSHRIRLMLPYLEDLGWSAHILAVDPEDVESAPEEQLLATIPSKTPVTRVRAVSYRLTSLLGFRGLAWRSLLSLYRSGKNLLNSSDYDLVYFSNTLFPTFILGVLWKRFANTPFVLDFQDPWYSESVNRDYPGGRLKYTINNGLAKKLEAWVVGHAAGITSVSPQYVTALRSRYPFLRKEQCLVVPFGGSETDANYARQLANEEPASGKSSGIRLVYVGRGGSDMHFSVRAFLGGLAAYQSESDKEMPGERVSLRFIGTSYAPSGMAKKSLEDLAGEFPLPATRVEEIPERQAYFEAFKELCASSAVLVFGSDDRAYSASKIYNCLLSGRPVLGILHKESLGAEVLREQKGAFLVEFSRGESWADIAHRVQDILPAFLQAAESERDYFDSEAFHPYSAACMTEKVVALFASCAGVEDEGA